MGLLDGYDAIAKAQDEYFDEVRNKWNDSVKKWRGISYEDYLNIETRADIVDLFAVGAEVFFMQNDAVRSGKIDKIEIYLRNGKHKVWYHIDSVKERLDGCSVFTSKDELKEYLATNGKCANSEFKTPVEDIRKTGYSINELEVWHLWSKWWIMYNNAPEQHGISHIKIEYKEDERTFLYGVDFPDWQGSVQLDKTIYFTAEQLFREKEDLIKSL